MSESNGIGGSNTPGGLGRTAGSDLAESLKGLIDAAKDGVRGAVGEVGERLGRPPSPQEGPGNNGRGNANGHHKHANQETHARLQETRAQAQQFRSRIEGRQTNYLGGPDHAGQPRRRDDDDGERDAEVRFWRRDGDGRSRGHDDDGGRLRGFERERRGLDQLFDSHANGLGRDGSINLPPALGDIVRAARESGASTVSHPPGESAVNYLRGISDGRDLPPSTRAVLDAVSNALGPQAIASLGDKSTGKLLRIVERALEHAGHAFERTFEHGGRVAGLPRSVEETLGQAPRGIGETLGRAPRGAEETLGRAAGSPDQFARATVVELLVAAQLARHLKHLEKTGDGVVRQAEAAVARALYGGALDGEFVPAQRLHPQEILRDLRAGAFLPAPERLGSFPLTGRARVSAEMMALMRTLDAVERAFKGATTRAAPPSSTAQTRATGQAGVVTQASFEASFGTWVKAHLTGAADGALDELLALLLPTLPGRAARYEIPATVAAMNGLLTDAEGRALLAGDGTPLKLDRLLWLGAAGGMLATSFLGSAFDAESMPVRLSPLLLYGFDAVYAVIGFDGRTLASPHYVAVQAKANDSEHEWVFGQQPFTAGWVRELIERLKDSAAVEHNLFGELLEEAWADGRFHVAMLGVAVEEGRPVADTSSVTRLLPGASGELAFAQ